MSARGRRPVGDIRASRDGTGSAGGRALPVAGRTTAYFVMNSTAITVRGGTGCSLLLIHLA